MLKRIVEKETKTVLIEISTDYIKQLADSAIIYPPSLPMICKPLIWDENKTLADFEIASGLVSNFEKVYKKNVVYYKAPGINDSVLLSSKDLYQIAKIINDTIFVLFPSLKLVYDYLIGMSDLLTKAKLPITWSAPSGLQITQNYLKTEVHKASIKSGNVAKTIVMRQSNVDKIDNRKQKQAIIPNVIHSLDASHLINLVTTANSIDLKPNY
jgi:DNA-directed RNA polymerase